MADRVFCIDFGSAFTKVALRADPTADGQLLSPVGAGSAIAFCIPSVIAAERRPGQQPRLEFGSRAADMTEGGDIRVFRNWKRSIFLRPQADGAHRSPLEALLASGEFADLATRFDVPASQVTSLCQMVAAARSMAA